MIAIPAVTEDRGPTTFIAIDTFTYAFPALVSPAKFTEIHYTGYHYLVGSSNGLKQLFWDFRQIGLVCPTCMCRQLIKPYLCYLHYRSNSLQIKPCAFTFIFSKSCGWAWVDHNRSCSTKVFGADHKYKKNVHNTEPNPGVRLWEDFIKLPQLFDQTYES